MKFKELVAKNRSYRRFDQSKAISRDQLKEWVDIARLVPCSVNAQPLKYLLINEPELNAQVFAQISFAAFLKDWGGPAEGQRPAAYILILGDTKIRQKFDTDTGIAAQTILLAAANDGYGGVMMGAINRDKLRELFGIPAHLELVLLLALGKPAEKVVVDELSEGQDTRYFRDEADVHHVPKRKLDEVLIWPEDLRRG